MIDITTHSMHQLRNLQSYLNSMDYEAGPVDGLIGPLTNNAWAGFVDDILDDEVGLPTHIRMTPRGIELLKVHEGYRSHVYKCTAGFNTLGYGRNIDANPLTQAEQDWFTEDPLGCSGQLLKDDLVRFEATLSDSKPWVANEPPARRDALINMTYNMGEGWLTSWPNTWAMMERGDWSGAAVAIRGSKYAKDVGNRAKQIAMMIETGEYS